MAKEAINFDPNKGQRVSSFKIGETVVCPDCQEDIANVCKDLHPGDKIDVTHFDFKPDTNLLMEHHAAISAVVSGYSMETKS